MKIQLPGDVSSLPLLPTNSKVSSTSTVVVKRFTTTATSTELLPKYHPQDSSQNFAVDGILPTDLVDVWPAVLNVGSTMDDLLRQVMEAEQEAQGSRMMYMFTFTDPLLRIFKRFG
jgi:hypothetical protein